MTELKTLKDLESREEEIGNPREHLVRESELKQEAIKWVKEIRQRLENWYEDGKSPNDLMQINDVVHTARGWDNIKEFIQYYNNITEEDLK